MNNKKRVYRFPLGFLITCATLLSACTPVIDEPSAVYSSAYDYTVQRQCFCAPEFTREIRVHVEHGSVTSAVYVASEKPVSKAVLEGLKSLEQWKLEITRLEESKPHRLEVEYSDDGQMPKRLMVDRRKRIADDEYVINFSDYQPK